jgi:hypothetical protein
MPLAPRPLRTERRLTYLLHLANADGLIEHYAGTTTRGRLQTRLDRHRRGDAKGRSRALYCDGFKITAVLIVENSNPLFEKVLAIQNVACEACIVCNHASLDAKCEAYRYDARPGPRRERMRPFDLTDLMMGKSGSEAPHVS